MLRKTNDIGREKKRKHRPLFIVSPYSVETNIVD